MTWEEREKKRIEQEELALAKKQAQLLRNNFKKQLEEDIQAVNQNKRESHGAAQHQDTAEFGRLSEKSARSIASFSKLAQPTTISYDRINKCIVKL